MGDRLWHRGGWIVPVDGSFPEGQLFDGPGSDGAARGPADDAEAAEVAEPAPAAGLGAPSIEAACEAILLLADEPMPTAQLAGILRAPEEAVVAVLVGLAAQYTEQGRGFDLRPVAGGWRYYTRDDCADVVSRFVLDGQAGRLSQAALETLAIIAYRQPIPRGRISAVRGVNVDGVVRTLMTRGLVTEAGTELGGQSTLLATTPYFLERLGIATLADLPPIADHVPSYEDLGDLIDLTEQA